jgi:hypothetical protein
LLHSVSVATLKLMGKVVRRGSPREAKSLIGADKCSWRSEVS